MNRFLSEAAAQVAGSARGLAPDLGHLGALYWRCVLAGSEGKQLLFQWGCGVLGALTRPLAECPCQLVNQFNRYGSDDGR